MIYYNEKNILSEIVHRDLDQIVKSNINWDRFKNKTVFVSGGAGSLPSIEKIKKIGWFPTTSLEEGFSKTIKSFIL
jgi:hypothetical protein